MSQSSFYGGRSGASFRIVKQFDGIDIPQVAGSYVYKRKIYAVKAINGNKYFYYPWIEKNGSNYKDYSWDICYLDGQSKAVVYSNNTTGNETVISEKAEGMRQCFEQGNATTNIVNYGEYVIINTIEGLCETDNPENGQVYYRGMNFDYDPIENPLAGGINVGAIVGPQGAKGEKGNFNILGFYNTLSDIPNQAPEEIMGDNDYTGWDVLIGDSTNPSTVYHLGVYNYLDRAWEDIGEFISKNAGIEYAVCVTLGNTVAKEVSINDYVLETGSKAIIKFTYENTAINPTLNISNTGAKALIANGESATNVIKADSIFLVVYDGTSYNLVGGVGTGGGTNDFIGTLAEWEALTPAQQATYADGIIYITDDTHGGGGSSSGGHQILNSSGTEMAQESKLQFINLQVTDDSINQKTIVTAPIATAGSVGLVKPDGTSIMINAEGTLSAAAGTSGHTIVDESGSSTAARSNLQFINATITDDSTNDRTVVTIPDTPTATSSSLGVVQPDNSSITILNGILTAVQATASEITLAQSGWDSTTGVYSLESLYPNASYDILDIIPNENTTDAMKIAWAMANCGGYRSTNTIKANGTIPSIDIIMEIFVRSK